MKVAFNLIVGSFLIAYAMVFMTFAHASSWCPTLSEAREDHGNHKRLYWHTRQRCWDNKRHNVHHWPHPKPKRIVAASLSPIVSAPAAPTSSFPDAPQPNEFAMRWPDTESISPLKWMWELFEFGRQDSNNGD